jgi:glyoxylase-like metal-dependent hydrolase (beta-lactamase superfamily II)
MNIERIVVRETNCYLLRGEQGTILIDPGPPRCAPLVIAGAAAAGILPGEIRLILVTHGHIDHFGGAPEVRVWCGAPVAAFRDEPAFTQTRRNALPPGQSLRGDLIRRAYLLLAPAIPYAPLQAGVLLDEGADLSPYGVEAHVLRVPGHAPGSLAVITAEGDAFVGDLFVNYTVPSRPIYISDRRAWEESYRRVQALKPRTVYSGHGEPFPGEALAHIYPARYQFRWWVW